MRGKSGGYRKLMQYNSQQTCGGGGGGFCGFLPGGDMAGSNIRQARAIGS